MTYYVVNTGRIRLGGAVTSRGTHIMWSKTPGTSDPGSPGGIAAQLIWFGGNAKTTLCGLPALRNVSDVFTPGRGVLPGVSQAVAGGDGYGTTRSPAGAQL
jgi:hypothetical protein